MHHKILLFLSLAVLAVPTYSETSRQAEVTFQPLQHSLISVPVFISGHGPYDFVVDTGTETSLIDPRLAQEIGLAPAGRIVLRSSNGDRELSRGVLPKFSLGAATVIDVEVLVDDLTSLSDLNPRVRGVLGHNFLSQFGVLLDYRRRQIVLFSGHIDAPIAGEHIPLKLLHGLPVLAAQTADGGSLDLTLDSGASTLTLFQDLTSFHSVSVPENQGTLKTLIATSRATQGTLHMLVLGQTRLRDIAAFLVDRPEVAPTDGMLPTDLFSQVFIDSQDGYAILGSRLK